MKKYKITYSCLIIAITFYLNNASFAQGDIKYEELNPKLYMPLAIGNSWTYEWRSFATPDTNVIVLQKPIMNMTYYSYNNKRLKAKGEIFSARAHKETYTITRSENNNYFFTISTDPSVIDNDLIRDGRYFNAVEFWWYWIDNKENYFTLGETIKNNWHKNDPFMGAIKKSLSGEKTISLNDFPYDYRFCLIFDYENGKKSTFIKLIDGLCHYITQIAKKEIKVPSGVYKECIETIEEIHESDYEDSPILWETHMFWAPNVGKVYEYQISSDGLINYELRLIKFSTSTKKK